MKICINDGFIIGYSETRGTEVDAADWTRIQDALNARPQPDDGCQVMLRADTLEWVQIPLPQDEDDPMPISTT